MMKQLGLITIALSALLLSGCGGSKKKDSNTKKLKAKNAIGIYHNMSKGSCLLSILKPNYFINPIIFEEANTASCQHTYGRPTTSDIKGAYCRESTSEVGGNVSCVIGFDDYGDGALNKKTNDLSVAEYIIGDMPIL